MTFTPLVLFDARIYYASLDATGFSNKVDFGLSWEDLDRTTFGSNGATERVLGLADTACTIEGFWDAGDLTKPDDVLFANGGLSAQPLTVSPTSGAVGTLTYLTKVAETTYKPGADVGKLLGWSADMAGNQPTARGLIMHPQGTARIASGNGTGFQLGAVLSTQRMYANLHVMSIAGTSTPSITAKLQSSVDNTFASPTDRITFTAATTLQGQCGNVLGAVTDQWWRVTWAITGSSPSFLFCCSAGIASK